MNFIIGFIFGFVTCLFIKKFKYIIYYLNFLRRIFKL